MTERHATVLGFAAASAVPPLIIFLRALPTEAGVNGVWDALVFLAVVFLTFLPMSALIALIVGCPAYFVARRFGIVTWWFSMLVGALAGALAVAAWLPPRAEFLATYPMIGALSGAVFWLVWRKRPIEEHP